MAMKYAKFLLRGSEGLLSSEHTDPVRPLPVLEQVTIPVRLLLQLLLVSEKLREVGLHLRIGHRHFGAIVQGFSDVRFDQLRIGLLEQ